MKEQATKHARKKRTYGAADWAAVKSSNGMPLSSSMTAAMAVAMDVSARAKDHVARNLAIIEIVFDDVCVAARVSIVDHRPFRNSRPPPLAQN